MPIEALAAFTNLGNNSNNQNLGTQQQPTAANTIHNPNNPVTPETLAQSIAKALHAPDCWSGDNISCIPMLFANGVNSHGERTVRPAVVFEKIEEVFSSDKDRCDALLARARGTAIDALLVIMDDNPNASYTTLKEILMKKLKTPLSKIEFDAKFHKLRREPEETIGQFADRISGVLRSYKDNFPGVAATGEIDNRANGAIYAELPYWLKQEMKLERIETTSVSFNELKDFI